MKLKTLLENAPLKFEASKLLNKKITVKGVEHTITKVIPRPSFGQNFTFVLSDMEDVKGHPYNTASRAWEKAFSSILPAGLAASFSESGMQGEDAGEGADGMSVNLDVHAADAKKPPLDVKKDFKLFKEFIISAGFKVRTEKEDLLVGEKSGKGNIMFTYNSEDDENDERYSFLKWTDGFWMPIINGDYDTVIKYISTGGRGNRYIGKAPDPSKEPVDRKQKAVADHDIKDPNYEKLAKKFKPVSTKGKITFQVSPDTKLHVYLNGYVRAEVEGKDRLQQLNSPEGSTDAEKLAAAFKVAVAWVTKKGF